MKLTTYIFAFLIIGLISCKPKTVKDIAPIYVEPYYNSNPFKINVGDYSEQLKTDDDKKILEVAQSIISNIDKVNIQTLFVLSNRLYDLKKKDEAIYWFYTSSFRRNVFKQTVNGNNHGTESGELTQAMDTYKKLLGEYVNGYALGNIDKNVEICKTVVAENSKMKTLSIAYPNLKFDDTKLETAIKNAATDREEFIKYMLDNKDEIKKQRTQNGIDNKY